MDTGFPHISLHAMSGLPSSETFRVYGTIKNTRLTILIDSGSTHNFLQARVAQFLNLPVETTRPLRVLIGNGSVLDCNQHCPDTQLSIQGHSFPVTFHLLQISGADTMLGIDWLKQFGPITTDYTSFIMRFTHLGQEISLHTDVALGPKPASAAQVKCLIHIGSTSTLFHLRVFFLLMPQLPPWVIFLLWLNPLQGFSADMISSFSPRHIYLPHARWTTVSLYSLPRRR